MVGIDCPAASTGIQARRSSLIGGPLMLTIEYIDILLLLLIPGKRLFAEGLKVEEDGVR